MPPPNLCTPAMLYLFFSCISIVMAIYKGFGALTILVKIVFVALWTYVLNYLCDLGHTGVAWFLVLLPFIILLGMFVIAFETLAMQQSSQQHKHF